MFTNTTSRLSEVKIWQSFLASQGYAIGAVDGVYGHATRKAVQAFQKDQELKPDGIIGVRTLSQAEKMGMALANVDDSVSGKPDFGPMNPERRSEEFGGFGYSVHQPTKQVIIKGRWASENIVSVMVPQLKGVRNPYAGIPLNGKVWFHRKAAERIQALFEAWETNGLSDRVLTWGGGYVPRLVRDSQTLLSSHTFGIAFDINMQWNGLGCEPARLGENGCVRELVHIANAHGFYWGGHFSRKDGMHFELAQL
ncbi:hypothetical protein FUAX_44450 (plasmid) [Fulvitalea axinellae]|uniref:Peptidoglycan-binding protein n=1 Tax=Fulvitalea axinellae TaxID=1182444 RepID=A0AAU9CP03_9BACT|nr:hypothetical protein FUAX_44450 [Fulvitalea axinellae]